MKSRKVGSGEVNSDKVGGDFRRFPASNETPVGSRSFVVSYVPVTIKQHSVELSVSLKYIYLHIIIFVHTQTDQGVKCVPVTRAEQLAGSDPDYNNRMLYNAIANGKPVSYFDCTFYGIHLRLYESNKESLE